MLPKFTLALITTLLAVAPASAQGPRGGGGMGGPGAANLSRNKSVQEELKVTSEQSEKINQAFESSREKFRDEMQAVRDADQSERREKMEALTKKMQAEAHKSLTAILSPDQFKRFVQIERQENVLAALSHQDVRSELKLTDDQEGKIKQIHEDLQKSMRAAMQGGGGEQRERREKMMTERKEAGEKAVALLTDEQKSTWKDLVGAPFEVKHEAPRRP